MVRRAAALLACCLPLLACREPVQRDGTDSALPQWRVADIPTLQIGEATDGAPEKQFANVSGVHRLGGGRLGVFDSWVGSVLFFDSLGGFLGRAGRIGNGPGEFPRNTMLSSFSCGDDTLYVATWQRISLFTPPNRFVRAITLDRPARIRACTSNRFVGEVRHGGWRKAAGVFTDSVQLVRFSRAGVFESAIDTLPWQETDWVSGVEGFGYSRLLFGRALSVSGRGSLLLTGFGDSAGIALRDSSGAVARIVHVPDEPRTVQSTDVERFKSFVFDPWQGNESERAHLEERLAKAQGKPLPAYAELRLDEAGNIWARMYDNLDAVAFYDHSELARVFKRPKHEEPRHWKVIAADGHFLASIDMPPGFTVHDVGEGWVLGVWRDALDIPFVRRYRLEK